MSTPSGLPIRWLAATVAVTVAALASYVVTAEPSSGRTTTARPAQSEDSTKRNGPSTTATAGRSGDSTEMHASAAGWCQGLDRPLPEPATSTSTFVDPRGAWSVRVPAGWQSAAAGKAVAFFPPEGVRGVQVSAYRLGDAAADEREALAAAGDALFARSPALAVEGSARLEIDGAAACHVSGTDAVSPGGPSKVDVWLVVVGEEVVAFERRVAAGGDSAAATEAEAMVASLVAL